ncbi:unnamed protein product [Cylicostephanus goldi]|uniref:Uncharacterized protein n=1 Tax=Cylicostephanus goldi TaxID=71465 RepID=A0A3P7QPA4_CYLGO|nr:unnamed protein product [Cylicostephanus goldi]
MNYQRSYRYSCAFGYTNIRNFGRKEAANYPELVRVVKKKFKLAEYALERRKNLPSLEEEDLEMDDFVEDDVEEEGDEEEATRILVKEEGDEEEATKSLEVARDEGDVQIEPFLLLVHLCIFYQTKRVYYVFNSDTRQGSSQPLTQTKSSPRKRPRVLSPVEDVPEKSLIGSSVLDLKENVSLEEGGIGPSMLQAAPPSPLKQFDRPPTDSGEGPSVRLNKRKKVGFIN